MPYVELSDSKDGIATVTINRPEALNALSHSVLAELDGVVSRIESSADIGGVIVTGAGRAFVAGADIQEISGLAGAVGAGFSRRGQAVFTRIERLGKPVVAAVNGFALGGGCELALACHIRVASAKARFGQPEVKLGILPGFGGTQRLALLVGRGVATEMILTGRTVDAAEALRIGLVNDVVEPEALLDRAREILRQILTNGPRAVTAALAVIDQGLDLPIGEALELEARSFGALCGTDEMREGTSAFLAKREPVFKS